MQCPKCETVLLTSTIVSQISVDRCDECGGIWFDDQELIPLLRQNPHLLRPLRGASDTRQLTLKKGKCPRDASMLLRVYSHRNQQVVLDSCPQCQGVWLDGGEFDKLLNA